MIVIEQVSLQDYEKLAIDFDGLLNKYNRLKQEKTTVENNYDALLEEKRRNMQIRNSYEKKSLCQIKDLKSIIDDKEEEICNLKHIVDCINKKQATTGNVCNKKCCSTRCKPKETTMNTGCSNKCRTHLANAILEETDRERQPSLIGHNGCGEKQQLLSAIENSSPNESSDPIETALEQSEKTIDSLSKNTQNDALEKIQNDLEGNANKLTEEQKISERKDHEIREMKTDIMCLEEELKRLTKKESILSSSHSFLTEELLSKTIANNELLEDIEKLKDKIVNIKHSLNSRTDETKALEKELLKKNQTIENNIKIEQELQCKLNNIEKKLEELQILKNNSECKYIELSKEYTKIDNELKKEKIENSEKTSNNEALCNKILNLTNVIKGFESQNILYTEEISKLKADKCTIQQKLFGVINENNCVVETLKSECEILRSNLACAEKNLIDQNEKIECLQINIRQHQLEITCFGKQIEDYKIKNDILKKKCACNDFELAELNNKSRISNNRICELTDENEKQKQENVQLACKMHLKEKELEEMNRKVTELNENCCKLEKGKNELDLNIDEITNQLLCAKKNENSARKELIICHEKLDAAAEDINNFELEKSCIKKDLSKMRNKLCSTEQKLQDTINKLNEETCLKNQINEKYLKIINTCSCQPNKCIPLDNTNIQPTKPSCKNNVQCQTDISENILQKLSEHDTLLAKNNKLVNKNEKLQKCTKKLQDNIQKLTDENNILRGKEMVFKKLRNKRESISIDTGVQAKLCPDICQSKTGSKSCESESEFDPNNINVCNAEICNSFTSCDPSDMSFKTIAPDTCPLDNDLEKEKLKCQLNELKKLVNEQEKSANKILREMERRYSCTQLEMNKDQTEMKLQYQKKLEELDAQLITYETNVLYTKRQLKESQLRETQLKNDLDKIKETLKNKDQVIEYEQNKVVLVTNNLNELKKQLNDGREVLESEKLNKHKLEGQTESFMTQINAQYKKVNELEKKLESAQKTIKKLQSAQNTENCYSLVEKKTKRNDDSKSSFKNKKYYGPKLNLPCCIGAKNPCNRQNKFNLQTMPSDNTK